jgi:hypothetical protein
MTNCLDILRKSARKIRKKFPEFVRNFHISFHFFIRLPIFNAHALAFPCRPSAPFSGSQKRTNPQKKFISLQTGKTETRSGFVLKKIKVRARI